MSEIDDPFNKFIPGPTFSEIFDMLKQQMIEQKCNKAQYIGKGEFLLFNDDKEPPCAK